MTPMRQAFITALQLVEHQGTIDRHLITKWLIKTMDRARDDEESAAAAQFAAAAVLYFESCQTGNRDKIAAAHFDFEILTQKLAAVMLLRPGRLKCDTARVSTTDHARICGGISLH
jgi:hypothetical protein